MPRLDRRDAVFLVSLLLLATPVYLWNWREPFIHHWESHGALYSLHAENLLRFGRVPLDIAGPTLDNYPDLSNHYHNNHPPLPQVFLATAFAIGGVSEASYRLLLTLFAFAGVLVLTAVLRAVADRAVAWAGVAIYALMPLISYYSTVNGQLAMVMFFAFLELLAYVAWRASNRRGWLVLLGTAQLIGCWIDWQAYYVPLVILAHQLWTRRAWRLGAALLALDGVAFLSYVAFVGRLGEAETFLSLGRSRLEAASILVQLWAEAREIGLHVTFPAALAAMAGLGILVHRRTEDGMKLIACLPLLGMDEVIFRKYVVNHDFLIYPLGAFFAVLAGLGVVDAARRLEGSRVLRVSAIGLFAAAFVGQTAFVLRNRFTGVGAEGVRHQLALAVKDVTGPQDRVFIIGRPAVAHLGFYAKRYVEIFEPGSGLIARSNVGSHQGPFTLDEVLGQLKSGARRADWLVYAEEDEFLKAFPSMAALPEPARRDLLDWWYVERGEGRWSERLRWVAEGPRYARGYTFRFLR